MGLKSSMSHWPWVTMKAVKLCWNHVGWTVTLRRNITTLELNFCWVFGLGAVKGRIDGGAYMVKAFSWKWQYWLGWVVIWGVNWGNDGRWDLALVLKHRGLTVKPRGVNLMKHLWQSFSVHLSPDSGFKTWGSRLLPRWLIISGWVSSFPNTLVYV